MMVPWTKIELTEMKTSRQIEDKFRAPICERQCIPDVVLRNLYIHQSCCCLIEHLIYSLILQMFIDHPPNVGHFSMSVIKHTKISFILVRRERE